MDNNERKEISLQKEFDLCENVIKELESGSRSTRDLQDQLIQCEEKLKNLTKEVSARALFSSNESFEELPTSSLNYLFLPLYLAEVTQSIIVEPEDRLRILDHSKIYLRDFLERLKSYGIIGFSLPWISDDDQNNEEMNKARQGFDPSKQRKIKVQRFQQEKELTELVKSIESELYLNADDDSLMRELVLYRLRLGALKALNDLDRIDEERPLAKHMLDLRTGQANTLPKRQPMRPAQAPFIITRDEAQKKVFGRGYPSLPTMTVDEWYDDMMKKGRFGTLNAGTSEVEPPSNVVNDETAEDEEEGERARLQKWDEYKDYHRRGWGNMQNKG